MNDETQAAGAASVKTLWKLHQAITEHLLEALKRPPVRASLLAVCRDFLRDNGVDARGAGGLMEGLEGLQAAAKFPFDTPPPADK